jgi:hypothetical protein
MGEPAASEAATSERDILLATKLNVPGLRPDLCRARGWRSGSTRAGDAGLS